MGIASNDPRLDLPKPEPRAETKRRKRLEKGRREREQRALVLTRSQGQCEVCELGVRCGFPAREVHHLIGGHGRRGIGVSGEASHMVALCREHHADAHQHLGYIQSLDEDCPARRVLFIRRGAQ